MCMVCTYVMMFLRISKLIVDKSWVLKDLRGHAYSNFTKLETSKIKKTLVLIYITVLPLPSISLHVPIRGG